VAPKIKVLLVCLGLWLSAAAPSVAGDITLSTADAALADTFTLQGLTAVQPRRADGGYDWDWRGPRNDPEWAWFFNRHAWFPQLLAAYRKTGDIRYEQALLDTLDDWIIRHPAPGHISFSAAWRPLEAARRLVGSWLRVMPALKDSPLFTPERRERYRLSLIGHGNHLRNHHAFGGNHLVTEMLALVELSLAEPDLPDASEWLAYGLDQLARAYDDQIYPDGAHKELSTHYQRVIALNYQGLVNVLREHGRDELAAEWTPRVDRLWTYIAAIRKPDGSNPLNNDSDLENYDTLLASNAPEIATLNLVADTHFPWAGQTVFHSGNHWAFFDAGPRGTDHDHDDLLQFSLSIGSNHFLVDNGRYTYAPGPWRDYFKGPAGHNILLLDGHGADAGPRSISGNPTPARYQSAGPFTLAWGDAVFAEKDKPRTGDWRRIIVHSGSAGWVVVDRVIAFGHRQLTTQWHWFPRVAAVDHTPDSLLVRNQEEPLQINLTTAKPGEWSFVRGAKPPAAVQGWYSPRFNFREPALCTLYTQRLAGPLLNAWIFAPRGDIPLTAVPADGNRVLITAGADHLLLDPADPAAAVWTR
jgi:hypothetical protein